MATWSTTNTSGTIKVTIAKSGGDISKDFDGNTTVAEACLPYATEQGLKGFDVEDEDGNTIDEDEGSKKLSEVGNLTIYPQAIGA
jgi:hypothetical protein